MSEVGLEVRRRREAREWSQAKLAVEAGMAVSAVSQIENGKRRPSANSLEKLAGAFGVEIGDLFPKASAPLFTEPPSEDGDGEGRREYPYDWMAEAFAELIDYWGEQVDKRDSPSISRQIAFQCQSFASGALVRAAKLVDTWGSGELTDEEFERVRPEYLAFREEWWEVDDRLHEIARKGLEHYEEACGEAEAAGEVRELWELRKRREDVRREIRRLTREMSA